MPKRLPPGERWALAVLKEFRVTLGTRGEPWFDPKLPFTSVMDHSFHLPVVFDKSNVEGHFILSGYREGGHWRMVLDAANKYTSEIHDPVFPIIGSGETYEDAMMEVFAQFEDQFYSSRPLA